MRSTEHTQAGNDMHTLLRQSVRRTLKVPVVGRIVHIAAAIYRMPETRASIDSLAQRQDDVANRMQLDLSKLQSLTAQYDAVQPEMQNLLVSLPQALRQLHKTQQDSYSQLSAQVERLLTEARVATARQLETSAQQFAQQFDALRERHEFVRREIMFEIRYGASRAPNVECEEASTSVEPEIVDRVKFDAVRQAGLKFNLGCGHLPLDGYLNVDMRKLPGVDIVARADALPVQPGEVAEIMSAHLLEHFPQEQLARRLLPYWKSLLKRGGTFRAVVPDAEAMIARFSAGDMRYDTFREVTFGAQDYDGDFHYNMFTPASLSKLLDDAGFTDVQVLARGRPNGACVEFEIRAAT
jgi:predicted SAM-dependent methyltransferase/ElaB/YqjD/DUF883 family membrane-anchored ribosome-binding protein